MNVQEKSRASAPGAAGKGARAPPPPAAPPDPALSITQRFVAANQDLARHNAKASNRPRPYYPNLPPPSRFVSRTFHLFLFSRSLRPWLSDRAPAPPRARFPPMQLRQEVSEARRVRAGAYTRSR
jgi:hypothetical protein